MSLTALTVHTSNPALPLLHKTPDNGRTQRLRRLSLLEHHAHSTVQVGSKGFAVSFEIQFPPAHRHGHTLSYPLSSSWADTTGR